MQYPYIDIGPYLDLSEMTDLINDLFVRRASGNYDGISGPRTGTRGLIDTANRPEPVRPAPRESGYVCGPDESTAVAVQSEIKSILSRL